jgi:nucleoside-diphosphate-sugar epimerase
MGVEKNKTKTILITGPNGFIGRQLILDFKKHSEKWKIKVVSRIPVEDIGGFLRFEDFCAGRFEVSFFEDVSYLIHLAAIAHRFRDLNHQDLQSVNIDFLRKILVQLNPGVIEKIVFMSSYSVSLLEKNVVLDTVDYALTKQQGEQILESWYESSSEKCEVVMLRPAMVYGLGAPGNFDRLLRLLKSPLLLPFGSLRFPRSFIHVRNLTSAIVVALEAPARFGIWKWDIADPWDETLDGFIKDLNSTVSGRSKLLRFPLSLLRIGLKIVGKEHLFRKIALSFKIDSSPFAQRYQWIAPVKFKERFNDLRFY